MADLALSSSGDLAITGGDLAFVRGADAIAQHIQIRLATFAGEWFLDTRVGLPYFETILEKGTPTSTIRRIYSDAILATPGVTGINSLELDRNDLTRSVSITASITVTGQEDAVNISTQVVIP